MKTKVTNKAGAKCGCAVTYDLPYGKLSPNRSSDVEVIQGQAGTISISN
jgi:hypothetical protein